VAKEEWNHGAYPVSVLPKAKTTGTNPKGTIHPISRIGLALPKTLFDSASPE
jgi:hypothetical protein